MTNKQRRTEDEPEELPTRTTATDGGADIEPSQFEEIRHPKKRAYVAALALTGNRTRAAELAGVHKTTPYTRQWKEDRELQEAVSRAREMAADCIEDELYRRGVEGFKEPTGWYKGKPGGYVTRYDTTAAIFLLKGLKPEVYADRHDVRSTSVAHKLDWAELAKTARGQQVIDRIIDGQHPDVAMLALTEGRQTGEIVVTERATDLQSVTDDDASGDTRSVS